MSGNAPTPRAPTAEEIARREVARVFSTGTWTRKETVASWKREAAALARKLER